MSPQPYNYTGPVDCSIAADKTQCKGKSVIVTGGLCSASSVSSIDFSLSECGFLLKSISTVLTAAVSGANGLGEAYVRAFVEAGAFVTFCDINEGKGQAVEAELTPQNVCFVKCDTRSWDDQVQMFESAVAKSPSKSVDIVIANAGVGRGSGDPMMQLEDPFTTPTKPSTHIIDINLIGALYTFKLAVHYFRRSPPGADRDRCFIFIGSVAGFVDNLGSWEYSAAKFGLRGFMRAVRWHSYHQSIRVAYVAPYYVRTVIQSAETYQGMKDKGVEFATVDSCVAAIMKISCDKEINGHSFVIVPYSVASEGFKDAGEDDWTDENYWLQKMQRTVVKARGDAWS
ncbi:uncharacterized protein A1O9_08763 [Exophiala aquamarina CBS 119918]|uniref:Uncharacterized protein n=1 Tax=Exophiala aquamarina CBS 119918 TaxID=1182545 RepID=A0A072PHU6_9EURO|nr:uncharacterized protein A1O9_08763 [Exophiala aquamarina CBS 119918]KEF55110.1 hypothetical protein A1O9_08763 [Exophiala aquamarina CBS 119918]